MPNPLIRKLDNYVHLSQDDREALESTAQATKYFAVHTDLIHDGDPTNDIYLILSGWAYRYKRLPDGRRQIMAYFIPRFRPGERLVERTLCDLLGVSRTVVREVLRHLEAEGLVESVPHQGPIVARPDPAKAEQIYEIRALLEAEAARVCAQRRARWVVGRTLALYQAAAFGGIAAPAARENSMTGRVSQVLSLRLRTPFSN